MGVCVLFMGAYLQYVFFNVVFSFTDSYDVWEYLYFMFCLYCIVALYDCVYDDGACFIIEICCNIFYFYGNGVGLNCTVIFVKNFDCGQVSSAGC